MDNITYLPPREELQRAWMMHCPRLDREKYFQFIKKFAEFTIEQSNQIKVLINLPDLLKE